MALPFLAAFPASYFAKAFEFSRVFVHHWSVNFKFVPETVFVSAGFAKALLAAHLLLLFLFAHLRWCRDHGGVFRLIQKWLVTTATRDVLPLIGVTAEISKGQLVDQAQKVDPQFAADVLFGCNFVGIVCAR